MMFPMKTLSAPAASREISRSRRSSAATRHSRRGESRPHARGAYRPAARHRRARQRIADQKSRHREFMLHPRQRRIAALDLVGIEIGRRPAEINHLEAAHRDIGLVAVLFPEQPFVHLCGREGIGGNEIAVAGEIADDGVGLRQRAAIVEFDRRHLAGAVEFEELRGSALAPEDVDADPDIGQRQLVADPFHLQAIARIDIAVDFHDSLPSSTERQTNRRNR